MLKKKLTDRKTLRRKKISIYKVLLSFPPRVIHDEHSLRLFYANDSKVLDFIKDPQELMQIVTNHDVQKPVVDSRGNSDYQGLVIIDPNRNVQKLVEINTNHIQEHDPNLVQEKEHVDFTHDFRNYIENGSKNLPRKAVQINAAQLMQKDAQINDGNYLRRPVQSYLKYNASKSIEHNHTDYHKTDIFENIRKDLQLEHVRNFQSSVFNSSRPFPKRERFHLVPEFVHQYNRSHEIQSREILKFQEKDLKALSCLLKKFYLKLSEHGNENLTDSSRKDLNLDTIHYLKKRETVEKVLKDDMTERNHKTKNPLIQKEVHNETFPIGKRSEFGPTHEIAKTRPSSIHHFVLFSPVRKVENLTKVMSSSSERKIAKTVTANRDCYEHKPVKVDQSQNFRNPVQLYQSHNMREPVQLDVSHNMRKPVQLDPSHNMRKPVQLEPSHNMRKPIHLDPSHNMRKPIQLDPSHNLRIPVHLSPIHSMRTQVKLHPTHNLQTPVQVDPSHDLRKPVNLEPTHNLRKPVKSTESHDLRWPVLEEPDHDMRNPLSETDIFSEGEVVGNMGEFIKGHIHKVSKTSVINDPLHELLYDDEFLMLKCSRDQVIFNENTLRSGENLGDPVMESKYNYQKLFNESFKACGIPFNQSSEVLRKERKSTKWPWMVSLQQHIFDRFWHKCAGSLLNNLWVITAAHCVESRPKWDFLLRLGMDGESQNYIERFVDRMSIHPKFNVLNLDHDIALLRMDNPVAFQAGIAPICLPWRPDEIENKKAVALGWKIATQRNVPDDLSKEKTVPVLTNKECEVMFSETGSSESIQKSFLCASFENGHEDSCVGDSGGPLVIFDGTGRWILAGLYSWGKSCRTPNQPEVYIRISRYADWIENTISCYEGSIILERMD